jgi:hypothetical protein
MLYNQHMTRILLSSVVAAALGACVGSGTMTYGGGGYVGPAPVDGTYDATPDLVAVDGDPSVQVIADYDEPVFYSDSYYWRFYDGGWYRSNVYTGGWVYWDAPPAAVVRIGRPTAYVHYHPAGFVARHPRPYRPQPIVRDNRRPEGGVEVRDHREPYRPEPVVRDHREPEPVVRDHRGGEEAPVVRDHREYEQPRPEPRPAEPVVRDHREPAPAPAPVVRDHREPAPAPVVRDHREPPPKKDTVRDHRH